MQKKTFIPEWATVAEHLRDGLGYSEATLKRTRYTYNVFVRDYCSAKECKPISVVQQGIKQVEKAFESGEISRNKLLRLGDLRFGFFNLLKPGRSIGNVRRYMGKFMVTVRMKPSCLLMLKWSVGSTDMPSP